MKKIFISFIALCTLILFFPTFAYAENENSTIVATGQDVPTDSNLPEDYRFPEKYRDNAVQFTTEDGVLLCGYVLGEGNKGIILGHPSGWMVKSWLPFAERLVDEGYMVILWEFRNIEPSGPAYGDMVRRWDLDVLAAAQVLKERGATKILAIGASDGGTATAIAASNISDLIGLGILSSPKDSVGDAVEGISKVNVPTFFAVSTNDFAGDFYPHVKALYEASPSTEKQFNLIEGTDHGTDMINPDVPGIGYAALPKNDEQNQQRKELSDKLMLFVNNTFDKNSDKTDKSETDLSTSSPEVDEITETAENNNNISTYSLLIGLGGLFLLIIIIITMKIKRKK